MRSRIKRIAIGAAMSIVGAMGFVVAIPADAAVNDISTVTGTTRREAEKLAQARCEAAAWPGKDVLAAEKTHEGIQITFVCTG